MLFRAKVTERSKVKKVKTEDRKVKKSKESKGKENDRFKC